MGHAGSMVVVKIDVLDRSTATIIESTLYDNAVIITTYG